jgi:hypothetical protein
VEEVSEKLGGTDPIAVDSRQSGSQLWVNGAGGFPDFLTNVNGKLFFTAYNGSSGQELWNSDGKEKKRKLSRLQILFRDLRLHLLGASRFLAKRFFRADDGVTGRELWVIPGFAGNLPEPAIERPSESSRGIQGGVPYSLYGHRRHIYNLPAPSRFARTELPAARCSLGHLN